MVYLDELDMVRFRKFFLAALKPLGVTKINSVSTKLRNELTASYVDFSLYTDRGIHFYTLNTIQTVKLHNWPLEPIYWYEMESDATEETDFINVTFSTSGSPTFLIKRTALPQGNKEDV